MLLFVMLVTFSLLECFLTRRIPEYHLCMENCGDDPLDGSEDVIMCRDNCNEHELQRCKAKNVGDRVETRKCWKRALDRCIVFCHAFYPYKDE
ncbi:hypothetical protein CRM22_010569 [Opisthorchis felineus]|uniref:Uncharacterized protein n=1 Tax=Opisthorchis felineus TaxID=147828 RepID=A0A4S2KXI7_OPIFE|nr:hypothetical protein CRM22_010569 [Opisthorchis felineus]